MQQPQPVVASAAIATGRRLTGPNTSVWKYDLLTALSVFALGQGGSLQTSALRLIAAVTSRYDWRRDELSIGRAELSRLWQCSEATVKREMRRLRTLGLLLQIRPSLRGRVAAYRLGRQAIEDLTRPSWAFAGPDFSARMTGGGGPDQNVVTFPTQEVAKPGPEDTPAWAQLVTGGDPAVYRNWFRDVSLRRDGDAAVYRAPTPFVASQIETRFFRQMQDAARYQWPDVHQIRIEIM